MAYATPLNPRAIYTVAAENVEHAIANAELAMDALLVALRHTPGAPNGPEAHDTLLHGEGPLGAYGRLAAITRQLAEISAHLGDEGE